MRTILCAFFGLCLAAQAQIALNNAFYNTLSGNRGIAYTYFMTENFEAPGYENVWTQAGSGTINDQYDSPPAPLQGLFSLRIQLAVDNRRTTNAFAAPHSSVYGFGMVLFPNLPNDREFFGIWNGDTRLLTIGVDNSNGGLFLSDGTVTTTATVNGLSANTLYYVWFRYTKGSGANAVYEVAFSENTTKPTSGDNFRSAANGVSTLDANRFVIGATAGNTSFQIITDKLRLSDAPIGSNPE